MHIPQRQLSVPTNADGSALRLSFDPSQLRPLIEEMARAVLKELDASRSMLINGKLALTEPEAAALLALHGHQLRDLRRDGRINFRRIVGGRIRYTAEDLFAYLAAAKETGT